MLGKIFKTIVDIALTPIDVVKDVVTLGGIATDQRKPYTMQKVDKVIEDLEDII